MKGLLSLLLYMALLWAHLITITHSSAVSTGDFNHDFVWSDSDRVRISPSGHSLTLVLGKKSGGEAALISKKQFIFGQYDMQIKLTLDEKGRSTGTAAYYSLTSFSKDGIQDMLLFEFIPNENGKGYILQTNIYTNGHGKREETINLWFDPTDYFHKYSIFWNKYHVTFKVDGVAIRVFKNYSDRGAEYLSSSKPMGLVAGFCKDGKKCATLVEPSGFKTTRVKHEHNGRDWSKTPSSATFKSFKIDACVWKGNNAADCSIPSKTKWWNYPKYRGPTSREVADIKSIRKNYLVYDYCHDHGKFGGHMPKECSFPKY